MRHKLYLTSTAAIALAMAVQGVPVKTAQAQDADAGFSIEEIIVTARKREENIQDAPLSVSAFTSNMIESANIKTLDDVAKFTAGFSFDEDFQRSNSFRPVIRGQATILGEPGVSTFIDGVLITGSILDYDLNDVERIEIIKGPQSALYGRNTYSGAISIITKSPTDETSGQIKMEKAEFGQAEISASVRGPISDTLSYSLTARFYDRGGPFINTFDGTDVGQQNSKSLSGVLYYQPNEQLDIRVRARYSALRDDQPRLFTTDPSENNCFFDDGGTFNGNGRYFCGEIKEQAISIDDVRLLGEKGSSKSNDFQSSLTVNYDLSNGWNLVFISGYNDSDIEEKGDFGYNDESFNPFSVHLFDAPFGPPPTPFTAGVVIAGPVADFAQDITVDSWDYSNELRLAYEGNGWNLLLGGYFFDSKRTQQSNRVAPPDFATTVSDAYFGEVARMVEVCTANVGSFAGPCTPEVFNVAVDDLFPGGAFVDFAFAFNTIGLSMLTLDANRDLRVEERRNLATFGMVSRDVNDKLTVSVEARLTSEEITSNTTEGVDTYDFLGNLTGSTSVVTPERKKTFTNIDPRFTARYAISDGSNVYVVAATGTKPGGFNNTEVIPLGLGSFDQENVYSLEVGSKNVFMDGRLIVNIAAFRNTITGYQLTESVVIPLLNETTTVITNKGKVRLRGLELEAVFAPSAIPGLVINANYALTDSEFLKGTDINEGKLNDVLDDGLVNNSLDPAGTPCDATCDNVLPGSIVGRRLPRQAKHMFNMGVNYTRSVTDDWSIVLNGNVSHESKKFVQVHNLAWVGSATLLNGSIGLETESVRLIFWGKNLTKEDAVVSASRFADEGASFQRIFMGNPRIGRQFGATATYKF